MSDWRERARCSATNPDGLRNNVGKLTPVDPELFWPVGTTGPAVHQIAEAQDHCRACRVRSECLDDALAQGHSDGIWGGVLGQELVSIRRKQVRGRARAAMPPPPVPVAPQRRGQDCVPAAEFAPALQDARRRGWRWTDLARLTHGAVAAETLQAIAAGQAQITVETARRMRSLQVPAGPPPIVPAGPTRQIIDLLRGRGQTYQAIADAMGVSMNRVRDIHQGNSQSLQSAAAERAVAVAREIPGLRSQVDLIAASNLVAAR